MTFVKVTISEVSRLFPYSEAGKMERIARSPIFPTWDEAFAYTFEKRGDA